jgi:hypothetical protein
VLLRCSGQLQILAGAVLGLDLAAALQLGEALGHDRPALAELLPSADAGLLAALNQQTATSDHP